LDEAFETGDFVGKTEVVEEAGIKRVDVDAVSIEVVGSATVVIEVEDDEELVAVTIVDSEVRSYLILLMASASLPSQPQAPESLTSLTSSCLESVSPLISHSHSQSTPHTRKPDCVPNSQHPMRSDDCLATLTMA
jgi:hypothetical protein